MTTPPRVFPLRRVQGAGGRGEEEGLHLVAEARTPLDHGLLHNGPFREARDIERIVEGIVIAELHDATSFSP
jgi:hypothetical protein